MFILLFLLHSEFIFAYDYSRLSAIRYNRKVDTNSQILFNSFIDDQEKLYEAYDAIPYNGSGERIYHNILEHKMLSFMTKRQWHRVVVASRRKI